MEKKKTLVTHVEDSPEFVRVEPDLEAPKERKIWRRKYDGLLFYGSVYLGLRYYSSNGKLLKTPIKEKPEDYELVDAPEESSLL